MRVYTLTRNLTLDDYPYTLDQLHCLRANTTVFEYSSHTNRRRKNYLTVSLLPGTALPILIPHSALRPQTYHYLPNNSTEVMTDATGPLAIRPSTQWRPFTHPTTSKSSPLEVSHV